METSLLPWAYQVRPQNTCFTESEPHIANLKPKLEYWYCARVDHMLHHWIISHKIIPCTVIPWSTRLNWTTLYWIPPNITNKPGQTECIRDSPIHSVRVTDIDMKTYCGLHVLPLTHCSAGRTLSETVTTGNSTGTQAHCLRNGGHSKIPI